jgi:hypothetical protein
MVKATENGGRCDLHGISVHHRLKNGLDRVWYMLPEPLAGPQLIVEVHVFTRRPL